MQRPNGELEFTAPSALHREREALGARDASRGDDVGHLNYPCRCRIQPPVNEAREHTRARDFLRGRKEAKRGDGDLRIFLTKSPKSMLYVERIVTYTASVL